MREPGRQRWRHAQVFVTRGARMSPALTAGPVHEGPTQLI
jgi:hypothetical protein